MKTTDCFYLGYVSKKVGHQNEVILVLDSDQPEAYRELGSILIRMNKKDDELIPFFLTHTQLQPKGRLRVGIDQFGSDEVSKLVGKEIYLPIEVLPPLSGNQFYYHEVIGFQVIDQVKGAIGILDEVYDSPGQPLLAIKKDDIEILIPLVENTVVDLDRKQRKMTITCPEGLIDLYLPS